MPSPSDAYLIESEIYGEPPSIPSPVPTSDAQPNTDTANATVQVVNKFDDPPDQPQYIPGLWILGSTYNVLNGKYADPKSTMQQVIDFIKGTYMLCCTGNANVRFHLR